ncbi:MAG TPA: phosphotransferase [Gaiellaceae bacterium]|nr:phosphotransferase [Gaiellaceae bacterium]
MKPEAVVRAERALGGRATSWTRVESRGWARNEHWTFVLDDGARAFAKSAWLEPSVTWMRREREIYDRLSGPFMPRLLGWEDGERPLLVLEDLTEGGAYFPPLWRPGDVEAVLATLAELAETRIHGLPSFPDSWPQWTSVADDPAPFLSLGIASSAWLDRALPELLAAESALTFSGPAVLHGDVRSDNLCIRGDRAVLVDWNHACLGKPGFDVAAWLPSLTLEGGPQPDEVADAAVSQFAVAIAGYFAAHAGLLPDEGAPLVRGFQLAQLRVALPWACRVLGIAPPDR